MFTYQIHILIKTTYLKITHVNCIPSEKQKLYTIIYEEKQIVKFTHIPLTTTNKVIWKTCVAFLYLPGFFSVDLGTNSSDTTFLTFIQLLVSPMMYNICVHKHINLTSSFPNVQYMVTCLRSQIHLYVTSALRVHL